MRKSAILGLVGLAVLAAPIVALAVPQEGHFSGRSDHNTSTSGVFAVGELVKTYQILDTFQGSNGTWYPWAAGKEYTLVITATVASYNGASNPVVATFSPATFAIYEDTVTAANFANKATFSDGAVVLSGSITGMTGQRIKCCSLPMNVNGAVTVTGGTGMGNMTPCVGGTMAMNDFFNHLTPPGAWPDALGYEESYDTKWDCEPVTTSTQPANWGRVKALYR